MRIGSAWRAMAGRLIGSATEPNYEQRAKASDGDAMAALFLGPDTSSGFSVNARTAEGLATVAACVGAISSAIASLPALVYRPEGSGRIEDTSNPLQRLIRGGPNPWQTWPDFIEWLMASTLLRGNGLAEIQTDGRGAIVGLRPIMWSNVSVTLLPSNRLAYDITSINSAYGGTGRMRRLLADEVLHLRDRSDDGLIGRSRLSRAA